MSIVEEAGRWKVRKFKVGDKVKVNATLLGGNEEWKSTGLKIGDVVVITNASLPYIKAEASHLKTVVCLEDTEIDLVEAYNVEEK